MKKIWKKIITILVVFIFGSIFAIEISMLITSNNNYGVPKLFGYSFMSVLTDSMNGEKEDSLPTGTGIIIQDVPHEDIKINDVITFYSVSFKYPVTHRVVEISHRENGDLVFYTFGDNKNAQTCPESGCTYPRNRDVVDEKYVLGKVIYHNDALGGLISVFRSSWFIPVVVITPLLIIAVFSVIDIVKVAKMKDNEMEVYLKDLRSTDEYKALPLKEQIIAEEKIKYKIELQQEIDEEKQKYLKIYQKELEKQKKEIKKQKDKEEK